MGTLRITAQWFLCQNETIRGSSYVKENSLCKATESSEIKVHTYTFPMYMFGHTSSIWLRCSLQESKSFCKSFTLRYSFLLLLSADILKSKSLVLDRSLVQMFVVLKRFPVFLRLKMMCTSRCLSAITGQLPNLVHNLACSLTHAEGRTTNTAAGACTFHTTAGLRFNKPQTDESCHKRAITKCNYGQNVWVKWLCCVTESPV